MLRCGASDAFEITVEGGRFVESEHIGYLFDCVVGLRLDEAFGLRDDILFYPLGGCDAAGDLTNHFREMFGRHVQLSGVEHDFARLAVVFHDQLAETVVEFHVASGVPCLVLLAAVVVDELITDSQLREHHLAPVLKFILGVCLHDFQQIHYFQQTSHLFVRQYAEGTQMEFPVVVAEHMRVQVGEQLRRHGHARERKIVRAVQWPDDMARHYDHEFVLVLRDFVHVVEHAHAALGTIGENEEREDGVFVLHTQPVEVVRDDDIFLFHRVH